MLFLLAIGCTTNNARFSAGEDLALSSDGPATVDLLAEDLQPDLADVLTTAEGGAVDAGEDLVCAPQTAACGFCGKLDGTCVNGMLVFTGVCYDQGVCSPGSQQFSPDGCEIKTCGDDCQWPGWSIKPGVECVTGTVQSCNAGVNCPHSGMQSCTGCRWGACVC